MADNTSLIANTENIESVVISFSEQLKKYVENMNNEVEALKNAIVALKAGWQAEDYNTFAKNMDVKIQAITHELQATTRLQEYLKDVASQLRDFLETLRKAGDH